MPHLTSPTGAALRTASSPKLPPGGWEPLLDAIETAIVVTDMSGVVTYWSHGAEALYGWRAGETIGRRIGELVHADAGLSLEAWTRYREGASWSGDVTLSRKDGSPILAWATVSPLHDESGSVVGVVGLSRDVTAEREQGTRLRESEERFEQLAAHLPVVFWMTDVASGRLLYISPAYETIFGRPIESVYEDPHAYREAIHPDDRARIEQILTGRRAPGDLEYRIMRPDGSIRWIHDFSYPVTGSDGLPVRFAGIVTDVTAHKASERELAAMNESLRESEARFRELAEHIEAVFWLVEPDTNRLLYVSPSVERIFGITPEEMQHDSERYWTLVHPGDRARVRALLEHPDREVEVEYRLVRPTGEVIWVNDRSFPIRDETGRVRRLAGISTDITARHQTDEERALLTAAIDQTSDGMLLLEPGGVAVYANAAFEEITGYRVEELVGRDPRQLIDAVDMPGLAEAVETVAAGAAWSGPISGRRPDGGEYEAELAIWPLENSGDRRRNVVVVLRDRTELRVAERELDRERAERAAIAASLSEMHPGETLEETASQVVHEILRLPGISAGAVVAFQAGERAWTVAAAGPEGIPVSSGCPMPDAPAHFLHERAAVEPGVMPFVRRVEDGEMGDAWERLGTTAMAWVPLRANDEVQGLLAVTSCLPEGEAALERLLPALGEYAILASALLTRQLAEHRRLINGRRRIREMIERQAFHAVFQPVVELGSGTAVGYEALTRFADGLSPDLHFREAAAMGLGLELEQATLEAAEEASRRLPAAAWLSLNISPDLITDQRFLPDLVARSPRRLVLEVTEHSVVPDYQALLAALERLDHGARLAVDDAGAGFASLRHIIELRPDFVKLDIGLIRGIDSDQARQSIVAGMVHFASTTGCVLIGEGIETEGERQTLQALGLTFGQGYLFGRPQALPAETIPAKAVEPRAPALVA